MTYSDAATPFRQDKSVLLAVAPTATTTQMIEWGFSFDAPTHSWK